MCVIYEPFVQKRHRCTLKCSALRLLEWIQALKIVLTECLEQHKAVYVVFREAPYKMINAYNQNCRFLRDEVSQAENE